LDTELKNLRKSNKTSQQAIADFAGITTKTYRKYEHGEALPTIDVAFRLAAYYNMLVDDVFKKEQFLNNSEPR